MANAGSERFSPRTLARIVGVVSLIGIVTGAFDIGYVRSALIVPGDAVATMQHIAAHETLFRLGFAAHIVLCYAMCRMKSSASFCSGGSTAWWRPLR